MASLVRPVIASSRTPISRSLPLIISRHWQHSYIQNEPESPKMLTQVPGPISKQRIEDLDKIQNMKSVQFFVDYSKSIGNYIVDADGNTMLDVYNNVSSIPIGYNHPAMLDVWNNPDNVKTLVNRPALGFYPGVEWPDLLRRVLLAVAPPGLEQVTTMMCGSCSNENSFRLLHYRFMDKLRNGRKNTEEELFTCIYNKHPGTPNLTILSFMGGYHGRTAAALSATHSKYYQKIDVPTFDWPTAEFPIYKYPLEEYVKENEAEDRRCLQIVEEIFEAQRRKNHPISGVVIEPIQAEGGDNHASKEFFQKLQQITKENGASLLIDEVQTGGGPTGKMWAHEHFDLPEPPDVVSFSKKMLTGGFYHKAELRPKEPYRVLNTWVGDPSKLLLLEAVVNTIKKDDLLTNVQVTGDILLKGLRELEKKYPHILSASRGLGTFCSVDCNTTARRNEILAALLREGVNCGGCGDYTIRLRPSLIFQPKHAELFLERFDKALSKFQ